MLKKIKEITQKIDDEIKKTHGKSSVKVYLTLRFLVIICMILEFIRGDLNNAFLCLLSLVLFLMPFIVEKHFKVDLPDTLEIIIFLFIFSAEILGEINNFYGNIPHWDTILHTINGFLCASVGFSLVYLLNQNSNSISLSPFFTVLTSFCFSMTIGVAWEIFEYTSDIVLGLDMQKDTYIETINTVKTDTTKSNKIIKYKDIEYTILYDEKGNEISKVNNYIDIGLHDTMKDLIVNFVGALIFSIFGYLYITKQDKYNFLDHFLLKSRT